MPYQKAGRLIRLLAWLQVISVIGIIVAIAIPMIAKQEMPSPQILILLLLAVFPALYFVVGSAIKEHKKGGRIAGIVLGVVMLFGFPIGTLIGAYILWCLIKGWEEVPF